MEQLLEKRKRFLNFSHSFFKSRFTEYGIIRVIAVKARVSNPSAFLKIIHFDHRDSSFAYTIDFSNDFIRQIFFPDAEQFIRKTAEIQLCKNVAVFSFIKLKFDILMSVFAVNNHYGYLAGLRDF